MRVRILLRIGRLLFRFANHIIFIHVRTFLYFLVSAVSKRIIIVIFKKIVRTYFGPDKSKPGPCTFAFF